MPPLSNLSKLLKRTVTVQHRTETGNQDEYGNDVPGIVDQVVKGELQQHSREEAEGTLSQTGWLLILPPDTLIDTNDGVIVDGETFEVIGDPWRAWNPRLGRFEHVEATLRRTSGEEQAA
jgi:hypothetical protein